MDANFCPLLLQDAKAKYESELAWVGTDAGYYSACGSLSPTSSLDSSCLSPPGCWWGPEPTQGPATGALLSRADPPAQSRTRSRSKNPGKKRQSASEREKLRMRDLTAALHHLRTYLPPSVAPAGQTLTKIETLRLAIRYISHLSSQLGLPEDLTQAGSAQSRCGPLHSGQGGVPDAWCQAAPVQSAILQYRSQTCQTSTQHTASTQQTETQSFSSTDHRDTPLTLFPHCTIQHYTAPPGTCRTGSAWEEQKHLC